MFSKPLSVTLVILALSASIPSSAQQPPDSPPNPFYGNVQEFDYHFKHLSDVDQEPEGTWYYEREIQNLHNEILRVSWYSMRSRAVLIPEGFAAPKGEEGDKIVNNNGGLGRYHPNVENSIEYGRTTLTKEIKARAYLPDEEHSSLIPIHNPLWSEVKMVIYDDDGKKHVVNMKLVSRVENERGYYKYFYTMSNKSDDLVRFRWDAAISPEYLERTRKGIIYMERDQFQEVIFLSKYEPKVSFGNAAFLPPFTESLEKLGAAFAPAFVPAQQ